MSTPLVIALLALGFGAGLILRVFRPAQPAPKRPTTRKDVHLDCVDQMVLWGEVTGDKDYRM